MYFKNCLQTEKQGGNGIMAIGVFFILLAVLLIAAMPVGGVFGIMSILPSIINPSFPYGAADVARSMFAGMNSFTLLAVPLFMVSGMIMAEGDCRNGSLISLHILSAIRQPVFHVPLSLPVCFTRLFQAHLRLLYRQWEQ